jgi:hypothetical protein
VLLGCSSNAGATAVTVTVSPTKVSVVAKAKQQFTAKVAGSTDTAVKWSVNKIAGGSKTVGTISAAGLYTAPSVVPGGGKVTVTATSVANGATSGSATVTLLIELAVSPTAASVPIGTKEQFKTTIAGLSSAAVKWTVNKIVGGNKTFGTISSTGLYTAPASVPSGATVTITATSVEITTKRASATVTVILPPAAAPKFAPAPGNYPTAQTVTISDATSGATIYYTSDGKTPTAASTKFTTSIKVGATETIEAIATDPGHSKSAVAVARYSIEPISGSVNEGDHPVSGARVYLFAAAATGYGQPSVSLLNAADTLTSDSTGAYVLTGLNGTFSIVDDYACTPGAEVYLYSIGGDAGSGANDSIGMMAVLGKCPAAGNFTATIPFVWINEVSTVAAAYALAGFATDALHVSSSGTPLAATGVANAFLNAANLESLATGIALSTTPAGNGIVPRFTIDTLANILAACGGSTGPASEDCSKLFSNAKSNGSTGAEPKDTATAVVNIAHNPSANVAALFALATPQTPFGPSLASLPVPNDLSLGIQLSGGSYFAPGAIAIDAKGNAWMTNSFHSGTSLSSVFELSSTGAVLSGAEGYTGGCLYFPKNIAIDNSENVWVTNWTGGNSGCVTKLAHTGAILSGADGFTEGVEGPDTIAIDGSDNVWITMGSSGALAKLSNSGELLSGSSGYTDGVIYGTLAMAIDGSGDAWIDNHNNITEFSNTGVLLSGADGYTGGGLSQPQAIAIDGSGNAWVVNYAYSAGSVIKFSSSGAVLSGTSGYSEGMDEVYDIAIDGSGNALVANYAGNNILKLSGSGTLLSGTNGYAGGVGGPEGIVIDGSGNAWVVCQATNGIGEEVTVLTELIGVATPVVTPLAAGVRNKSLGTRP